MDDNILKVDLDLNLKSECIKQLVERLSYMHDLGAFPIKHIKKINLGKKTSYHCKIYLKTDLKPELIIMLQLILGSDYRKEVNTILNHFVLDMKYSNRCFDIKKYKDGSIKESKIYDVTEEVIKKVSSKKRRKYKQ